MGWVEDLSGQRVGLDTAPLIYFIEKHPTYGGIVRPFFKLVDEGEIVAITSTATLLEVLVYPIKSNNPVLAQEYRNILLEAEKFTMFQLSKEIAEEAARLRAVYSVRTPDAIQLATAILEKVPFFLTNDKRLAVVKELKVLVVDDFKSELL